MLVEFKRVSGGAISINADAVAYVEPALTESGGTNVCISGKEGDIIWVNMDYRLVIEQLQDAMS